MPTATWNGKVLAQAAPGRTRLVEGNLHFPPEAVNRACLRDSDARTVCAWKSSCSYNDVVDGLVNKDAAKHIDG